MPNFGLKLGNIIAEYDRDRGGDQREPGWWIQQLIKLGAATQIPGISPVYIGKLNCRDIYDSLIKKNVMSVQCGTATWYRPVGGSFVSMMSPGIPDSSSLYCKQNPAQNSTLSSMQRA